MRQNHGGGEKLFIDYAGDKVPVVDRQTGEVRDAHIFVAVMGGSSLSFALGTWTEQMGDWIDSHNAAFAFFGGVPQLLVPDNAKVAVIKACLFDPMVNRSYTDMARHCGTARRCAFFRPTAPTSILSKRRSRASKPCFERLANEPSLACGTSSARSSTSSSQTNAPTTSAHVAMIQHDRKTL